MSAADSELVTLLWFLDGCIWGILGVVHCSAVETELHCMLSQSSLCSVQTCINFGDALGVACGHTDLSSAAAVHQIFTLERDTLLCHSLRQSSLNQSQCVMGVVGVAHIPGIIQCWGSDTLCGMAEADKHSSIHDLQQSAVQQTAVPVEDAEAQGVRRALSETFLQLSCSAAVCADMQRHLPVLPPEAEEAYACTRELYGSPRMLLAALPREDLDKVSQM